MKEYSAKEVLELLQDTWDLHETGLRNSVIKVNGWLDRGDGIAVYVNNNLGSLAQGARQYVSYGSEAAQIEDCTPPVRLPDIGGRINHEYRLEGVYEHGPLPVPDEPAFETTGIKYVTRPFTVATNNHEPPRQMIRAGVLRQFRNFSGRPTIEITWAVSHFGKEAHKALYLVDDGKTVVPHYVSGWNFEKDGDPMWLDAFPTNPDGETRADNGRVIDYSDWMMGPKKAYHLKVED